MMKYKKKTKKDKLVRVGNWLFDAKMAESYFG